MALQVEPGAPGGTQCSRQDLCLRLRLSTLGQDLQILSLQAMSGYVKLCVFFSRGKKRKRLPGLAPQSVKLYVRHTHRKRQRWRKRDTQLEICKVTEGERQRLI